MIFESDLLGPRGTAHLSQTSIFLGASLLLLSCAGATEPSEQDTLDPADEMVSPALETTAEDASSQQVEAQPEIEEPQEPERIFLEAPTLEGWRPRLGPKEERGLGPQPGGDAKLVALATDFNAPIYRAAGNNDVTGRVRRGNRLPVAPASGNGCAGGSWYSLRDANGYICSASGFEVSDKNPLKYKGRQRQPKIALPLSLDYWVVRTDAAPLLSRLPKAEEAARLDSVAKGETPPEKLGNLVVQRMIGDYYMAVDEEVLHEGHRYLRTLKGQYVRVDDAEVVERKRDMHGEHLGENHELPLAFVYVDDVILYCDEEGSIEPCGEAERLSRFDVARTFEAEGTRWVEAEKGFLVKRSAVRIARARKRPEDVSADEKWAHINLDQQTLVAYEGDEPVFASMVSTGREGYSTPTGLWRTTRKYVTRTMRGGNLARGIWHVEEVPWAIYYNRGYAVHGAYWHDEFGEVQSRGCTNIAPSDARWLFYWSQVPVPDGWHAVTWRQGSWWYFTED